jgi:hypothetical protein
VEKLLEHLLKERGEEAGARAFDDLGRSVRNAALQV